MKTLLVRSLKSKGIELQAGELFLSVEESKSWENLLKDFLYFACLNRIFSIATTFPHKDSYVYELDFPQKIKIQEKKIIGFLNIFNIFFQEEIDYLISPNILCSKDIIDTLLEEFEFELGIIYLISFRKTTNEQELLDFFKNRQTIIEKYQGIESSSSNITDLSEEIFMRHADGEMILWLNPNRSLEEIISYLEYLTKRNEWNLRII